MYERTFSESIVWKFHSQHAEACDFIDGLYRIPFRILADLVQANDQRWRGYKSLVKHWERMGQTYLNHWETNREDCKKYYTFVQYLKGNLGKRQFPAPIDALDNELNFFHTEVAEKETGVGLRAGTRPLGVSDVDQN